MEKINKYLTKIIYIVMALIISFIILFGTIENGVLLTFLSFIFIILFVKKIKLKRFSLFLIIFCLITKIASILILNPPIQADYYIMLDATRKLMIHDMSFLKIPYFCAWGYQLPHVYYQAFILNIIDSIVALKILNCIYSTIITYLIYVIVKKITSEETARITSLLYAISIYPIYLNCILGNQQLAMMILLFSIYLFLYKKQSVLNLIIVGVLIGISNLERSEGIIYIATILVYIITNNKKIKDILFKSFLIILSFFIVAKLPSYILIKSGYNEIGFNNNDPSWKFLLGLNSKTNGKYDTLDEAFAIDKTLEKEEIKRRITDFKALPNLFYQKIKIQWLYNDLEESFNVKNTDQFSPEVMNIVINYIKVINFVIICFAFIGQIKNKGKNTEQYFFLINIGIYFIAYLFIEVCARYYYNPQISIIILSSIGINESMKILDNFKKKIKKIK